MDEVGTWRTVQLKKERAISNSTLTHRGYMGPLVYVQVEQKIPNAGPDHTGSVQPAS
jgi:hypothetical protein